MNKENLIDKIMELVHDYGVDSLRVGIYEQRVSFSDYYQQSRVHSMLPKYMGHRFLNAVIV